MNGFHIFVDFAVFVVYNLNVKGNFMAEFFNKNLKHIRKIKGLYQQDLADKMDVHRSMISYWENNKSDITVDIYYK